MIFETEKQAIDFDKRLWENFVIGGIEIKNFIEGTIAETYYYCDDDVQNQHKEEMKNKGWIVDTSRGVKETVYVGNIAKWEYNRLVFKKCNK